MSNIMNKDDGHILFDADLLMRKDKLDICICDRLEDQNLLRNPL